MVRQCQKGDKCASPSIKKAANSMTAKAAKKYAETSRKGLPEKVSECKMTFKDFLMETYNG